MPRLTTPEPVFTVLLVCTGNICRSALAERLGRAYLDEAMEGSGAVRLMSAGVRAVVGAPMHPNSALVLEGLGGDPDGFQAQQFVDDMAIDADLTLTMTRQHRGDVLYGAPRVLSRVFTLREAAALVELVGEDVEIRGPTLAERARHLVRGLAAARPRRQSGSYDDVVDPIGLPVEVHQEVGEVIAASLIPVLARIAALRPTMLTSEGSRDQDDVVPSRRA
ncbi:arsenate reductase/protein-tyrosine-phosphatase family protein [Geodermatophilus sp. SYSU D00710]